MNIWNSVYLIVLSALAGCGTLSPSGPSGKQIATSTDVPKHWTSIQIVQEKSAVAAPAAARITSPAPVQPRTAQSLIDILSLNDIFDINAYKAFVTLFATGIKLQTLTSAGIDELGNISVLDAVTPYAAGLTTGEIESTIRDLLLKLLQMLKSVVTLNRAITNTIIVGAKVARPGNPLLHINRKNLSGVAVLADDDRGDANNMAVSIVRGGTIADVSIGPGDRLMRIDGPYIHSILGESG